MKIIISSGHGLKIRGASGYLDEVDEARRVVNKVAEFLRGVGVNVEAFHDDVSTSQNDNLERICAFHNAEQRDLDVSVHFNCYDGTASGTEVLYVSQAALAGTVSEAIADAGPFKNRGAKKRTDLYFLNNTDEPAILIETCFVDSREDADKYEEQFEAICAAIAQSISGELIDLEQPPDLTDPPTTGTPVLPIVTITVDPPNSVKVILK